MAINYRLVVVDKKITKQRMPKKCNTAGAHVRATQYTESGCLLLFKWDLQTLSGISFAMCSPSPKVHTFDVDFAAQCATVGSPI